MKNEEDVHYQPNQTIYNLSWRIPMIGHGRRGVDPFVSDFGEYFWPRIVQLRLPTSFETV